MGIKSGNPTNATTLLEKSFSMVGSDIEWQTRWSSAEAVSVTFYDWGDGIGNYNNMNHMTSSNHLKAFSFALDKNTGKFVEKE